MTLTQRISSSHMKYSFIRFGINAYIFHKMGELKSLPDEKFLVGPNLKHYLSVA